MTATEILREDIKKQLDNADEKALRIVRAILEVEEEHDWWEDLSGGAKASVEQGLNDAAKGKLTPHEEVMKKYRKWL